ncbi:ATP-dependent DNA helicase At3g02060, chloroplastic isoform X5 [Malania oleifera]|uniref:ATP-dependent DNA helicase At3g02060, chloroplastic isoform X5 n=1 Tax=Malania oleifera TaxID=397392 RepID=UPI0025AEC861|nr:ATP-dependent DNA helicase At3g02060, chloroplastic isoform X5 [Malania oleifera]
MGAPNAAILLPFSVSEPNPSSFLLSNLRSSSIRYFCPFSGPNYYCPCRRADSPSFFLPNAFYTEPLPAKFSPTTHKKNADSGLHDDISILNDRIRRDLRKRDPGASSSAPAMDSEEAGKYIGLVKQQQQRGLRKLKGDRVGRDDGVFSYKVDPYTLRSGDYVVHKKVGIGRFVGIKFDVPKDSSEPVEYVFLEYADGMAKLPIKQASRMLYRYNLPNENRRSRPLSKLSDTSAWERRRIKGKIAIQKMVVDLMELYLHRLKQRRPPYPESDGIAEFVAQFPYEPTPDQKKTKAEKEECLYMIRHGYLDIIVGTHSLLGSRVVYNNLGLLVVDEEQRFGVKQKEKIASFKTSVDVLTLSATPIPRTLYLALTGFRDASLISTPPPERVPIRTHLSAYSKEKVTSAIKFELDRGGQVFYVLPRIKGLDEVMEFLEQSFPNVKIAIAHGKLRGRVGRADKEAYAHLFYPDKSLLSDQALERLAALEECRDLGQGFQLSERDMGIRGFGNIFGEQQTGDIGNVGIDLFFEMLFESLSKVEEHRLFSIPYQSVQLDININPHLPSEYITYLENPMKILSEAEKAAEKDIWSLMQFTENLRRQYGKEPSSMEILLKKLYVRRMAADLGISRIYALGKMVGLKTNMSKEVFKLIMDSIVSDVHRNSLVFEDGQIKGELLLELPREQLINWVFQCLVELHASLPALIKY